MTFEQLDHLNKLRDKIDEYNQILKGLEPIGDYLVISRAYNDDYYKDTIAILSWSDEDDGEELRELIYKFFKEKRDAALFEFENCDR